MTTIFLQRRFVKLLCDYYENDGVRPTREEFLSYIVKKEKFYENFRLWRKNNDDEKLRRRINMILGDCIEGKLDYMTYGDKKREKLFATTRGREFATSLGFFNELLIRYGAIVLVVISGVFGYLIKTIINLFSYIINNF